MLCFCEINRQLTIGNWQKNNIRHFILKLLFCFNKKSDFKSKEFNQFKIQNSKFKILPLIIRLLF
jgi:hypothetical protein